MTMDLATELCRDAVVVTVLISLPLLGVSMAVGLLISIVQAITQLQEQTLSFVPKLIAMLAVGLFTLPWTLSTLSEYAIEIFRNIPLR